MNILELFQYHHKLKFSDIERALKVRSNKLSYHLKRLTKKGILKKEKSYYSLSETSEHLIPYMSEKQATLPVVLIYIGDKENCILQTRKKRPFKDQSGLPGGRQLKAESINETVRRIMKEKLNIDTKLKQIHSVSIEHMRNKNEIVQTDIVIFVSATTKSKINLTNIDNNKKKIITSDYFLIKNDLDKKIEIKTINTTKF